MLINRCFYIRKHINSNKLCNFASEMIYFLMGKTKLSMVVKGLRKEYGLTQEDLAMKSGVGLCFVRNLEQGKQSLRMDKVNQLLDLFNYELVANKKS